MWIVKLALSRPYTFIVLALLILVLSPLIILRTRDMLLVALVCRLDEEN